MGRARSAAGAASLYNLRLPSEGLKHVDHWCFATCFFEGFDGEGEMLASLLFAEWDPCSYIDGEMAISTIAAVHWYTNMDVFVQRSSE